MNDYRPPALGGEKPERFTRWVLDAIGAIPSDDLLDVFTGSGAVGRAWETFGCGRLDFTPGVAG